MPAGCWQRLILACAAAALALPGAAGAAPPTPLGVDAHREAVAFANTIGTRPSASAAERRGLDLVARRFRAAGLRVARDGFDVPGRGRSGNAVGVYGTSARCLKILVAHADSAVVGDGAVDNASGVGMLIALGDRLAALRPPCGIWLVATGSEERGVHGYPAHLGARRLVARIQKTGVAARVRYVLSVDDFGIGRRFWLRSPRPGPRPGVERQVLAIARAAGVRVVWERDATLGNSDHREPEQAGIPGMVIQTWLGEDACRHLPCDTADRLERPAFTLVGRVVQGVVQSR
jgi:hypothetical protein